MHYRIENRTDCSRTINEFNPQVSPPLYKHSKLTKKINTSDETIPNKKPKYKTEQHPNGTELDSGICSMNTACQG